jgi:hypothetical protein
VRLRVCTRVGNSAAACVGRLRGLCHCLLLGAVVLLQEFPVQALERARGGGILHADARRSTNRSFSEKKVQNHAKSKLFGTNRRLLMQFLAEVSVQMDEWYSEPASAFFESCRCPWRSLMNKRTHLSHLASLIWQSLPALANGGNERSIMYY